MRRWFTWEGHRSAGHSASRLNRRCSDTLAVGLPYRSHDTPAAAALRGPHHIDTVAADLWDGHRRDTRAAAFRGVVVTILALHRSTLLLAVGAPLA